MMEQNDVQKESPQSAYIKQLRSQLLVMKSKLHRWKKRCYSKRNRFCGNKNKFMRFPHHRKSQISKLDEFVSQVSNNTITPSRKDNNIGTVYILNNTHSLGHTGTTLLNSSSSPIQLNDVNNKDVHEMKPKITCRSLLQATKEIPDQMSNPNSPYALANCRRLITKKTSQTVAAFHTENGFINGIEIVSKISTLRQHTSNIHFQVLAGTGYLCDMHETQLKKYAQFETFVVQKETGFVLKNTDSKRWILGYTVEPSIQLKK